MVLAPYGCLTPQRAAVAMKPLIFISSVSRELKTARQLVANTLLALGYEPVWQDIFETSPDDLREMLRKKIDICSAVLQIVGHAYGAEPPTPDATFGRCSYTQYEALYARLRRKPVYYLIAEHDLPRDAAAEMIDTPHGESDAAKADAIERQRLQSIYRKGVLTAEQVYYPVHNHQETELSVRRLRDDLAKLRRGFRYWMIGITAALVLIAGGVSWNQWSQLKQRQEQQRQAALAAQKAKEQHEQTTAQIAATGQKTQEQMQEVVSAVKELTNPVVLAERIRKEIHTAAEEKIKALPDERGRGRLIAAIEKERDLALGRVDDLIKLIQEGLKEGASPVFQRAAEILQTEGTDAAIEYLESRRPSEVQEALHHAERAKSLVGQANAEKELRNRHLQSLVLQAELLESKLQWQPALQLREQVAELAPDWFEARYYLGILLGKLAHYRDAEPHKRAALALADNPQNEAIALNNLAQLLRDTNRLAEAEPLMRRVLVLDEQSYGLEHPNVARDLNNLAGLLQATNRLAEAEPLMRRALAIDERSYGPEHPNVALKLNNLAVLLRATNRLAEAVPLMRRALVLDEQTFGPEHPNVALKLSNLAQLLRDTNRLAEAELLMHRALAIDEQSYGADHPDVASNLNNLAQLLQATNRLAEAEPLMRRALAIDEQSYGPEHPKVATILNNLAVLLQATSRLAEAEPLMRRALAIDEHSYGADHPDVARDLNNLEQLLKDTNRLAEAEPLMRRALAIDEQSYGPDHPNVVTSLNNLALLLMNTNRLAEAESLMHRALAIHEQSYGPDHPSVAIRLNNLARLLQATNRLAEAAPLMRRSVAIFDHFERKTSHEHPSMQTILTNYREILQAMKLSEDEIAQRVKDAPDIAGPLKPMLPEIELLLGPAKSVAEVLAALDRQYEADGKPAIYFLKPDQSFTPHLDQLLKPSPESLNADGVSAYHNGDHANAIAQYEGSLKLLADDPAKADTTFVTRMNHAAALRELGEVEQARDELRKLLSGLEKDDAIPALAKGRARYHLALCEWRLDDRDAAQREAEESLKEYGDDADSAEVKRQTEQLLADLRDNKPLPPLVKVDAVVTLEQARTRFRARVELATLPLNQSSLSLLDQMLGPAKSTKEVFEELDRQYHEQNKPPIWFLPLSEPISPHLGELLGPVPDAAASVSEPPKDTSATLPDPAQ